MLAIFRCEPLLGVGRSIMDFSRMRTEPARPKDVDADEPPRATDVVAAPANAPGPPSKRSRKTKIVIVLLAAAITILWMALLLELVVRLFS